MAVKDIIEIDELEKVAKRWKRAFTNMISVAQKVYY